MVRRLILALVAFLLTATVSQAAKNDKPQKMQVYMFGFAASMTDSVCMMTELQPVEVYLQANGFLVDRTLYSLQLNNQLVNTMELSENLTCAVFFDKSKSKAEKHYQKVRKRYRDNSELTLKVLGVDDFMFVSEEWVESEDSTENTEKPKSKENKKENKKEKKRKGKK